MILICFTGIGFFIVGVSLYGQWYWMKKNLKKDVLLEKIEQNQQLSSWEKAKWYLVLGMTKGFIALGLILLAICCANIVLEY